MMDKIYTDCLLGYYDISGRFIVYDKRFGF